MAGPDDEQVEVPTSLGGVTHNGGGPLQVTGRQKKQGEKCHESGTHSWKNQGPEGVLVFERGSSLPLAGG
jgi:hypothetical protein